MSASLQEAWDQDAGLSSPKLAPAMTDTSHWYRYYAGYADAFVRDVVGQLPDSTGRLVDPWNGAGTTTSVAAAQGVTALGFDVNPAAVVIAKARLMQANNAPSLKPLTKKLMDAIEPSVEIDSDDLLLRWMTPRSATSVRRLVATINHALVEKDAAQDSAQLATEMSPLASVFYLALFRVVRRTLSPFGGTNPTWLRQRVTSEDKVDVDLRTLRPAFIQAMTDLTATVGSRGLPAGALSDSEIAVAVAVADSGELPLEAGSAGAVITSPPYCTRIDYAIATLPELAAIGMSATSFRTLRDRLIGTPTRDGSYPHSDKRWGDTANSFLARVAEHSSHASQGYYLSFFSQYFAGMWRSLAEIERVVAKGSPIVLVVQDSYYKEIRVDVPGMMCDMARTLGWESLARRDFHVKTRARLNPATRRYRESATATEAVLAFSS